MLLKWMWNGFNPYFSIWGNFGAHICPSTPCSNRPSRACIDVARAEIEIISKNGEIFKGNAEFIRGSPEKPLSKNEIIDKFLNLTKQINMNETKAKRIVELVDKIEALPNISSIMDQLY